MINCRRADGHGALDAALLEGDRAAIRSGERALAWRRNLCFGKCVWGDAGKVSCGRTRPTRCSPRGACSNRCAAPALFEEIDLPSQAVAFAPAARSRPERRARRRALDDRFLYLPHAPRTTPRRPSELDDLFQAVSDLRPLRLAYKSAKRPKKAFTIHPYALGDASRISMCDCYASKIRIAMHHQRVRMNR